MNIINKKKFKIFEKKIELKNSDHDVLVDLVHIPEGGKMQISPKLEQYWKKPRSDSESASSITLEYINFSSKSGGGFSRSTAIPMHIVIVMHAYGTTHASGIHSDTGFESAG